MRRLASTRSVLAFASVLIASALLHLGKLDATALSLAKFLAHSALHCAALYAAIWLLGNGLFGKAVVAAFVGVELFSQVAYGSSTTVVVLMSILNTTPGEAESFLLTNAAESVLVLGVVLGILTARPLTDRRAKLPILLAGIGYLLVPALLSIGNVPAQERFAKTRIGMAKGQSTFVTGVDNFLRDVAWRAPPVNVARALMDTANALTLETRSDSTWADVTHADSEDNRLLVIGIGESLRAESMSLYGYGRDTTPRLRGAAGDLDVYENAYSAAANTWVGVPAMLTKFDGTPDFSKSIIGLANAAGYETHWISNHGQYLHFDVSVSTIANQADHADFVSGSESGVELDLVLVEKLRRIVENRRSNAPILVVLHFYGSHATFSDRYPGEFELFDGPDPLVDEYDNSIRYTDHVQAEAIELVREAGGKYLFFADHGLTFPELKHDIRSEMSIESLRVPLLATAPSGLGVEEDRYVSLLYFECLFARWADISAPALDEDGYCDTSLGTNGIDYMDANMNVYRHTPE